MAYSANNLALSYEGGAGAAKTYRYVTTDSAATVQASGYFNSPTMFNIGDVIQVRFVDAVSIVSRAATTGSLDLIVASNDGTTVTTTLAAMTTGSTLDTTATTLTITRALHHGRTITVSSAAPIAVTLPQATGSGSKFKFVIEVAATGTSHTIKVANATDVMQGVALALTTASANVVGYGTSATSDTISLNGTTLGGVVGDIIEIEDIKTGFFAVKMVTSPTGTTATPFSASV